MTKSFKLGTFNAENLFLRYTLRDKDNRGKPINPDRLDINALRRVLEETGPVGEALRSATSRVILENAPDVLALQEVENLEALNRFNYDYLKKSYNYMMVIDGNDPRQIDVAVLSKFDLTGLRTHRFEPAGSAPAKRTFSRDCLEVAFTPDEKTEVRVYINHFKSKLPDTRPDGTPENGETKRKRQATRLAEIIRTNHKGRLDKDYFAVLGDLNCDPAAKELKPLLASDIGLEDVLGRLPKQQRWTHFYARAKSTDAPFHHLDHLLISPAFAKKNPGAKPQIERRGLNPKAFKKWQTWSEDFGKPDCKPWLDKGEASDHCGVFITLKI